MNGIKVKEILTCAGSSSVFMLVGGIVTAVMPPQVGLLYKGAAYIGGLVLSMVAADPIGDVIDRKFEEGKILIDQAKECVNTLKEVKEKVEREGA